MALDQAYFDAIHIDVVKKKYYNANKVETVLADIRYQAERLNEENALLYRQLQALNGQKDEIGDTLLSAKTIARQMILDAQAQAEQIRAGAEAQRAEMERERLQKQQETVERVERLYLGTKKRLSELSDSLDEGWQSYLCSLDEGSAAEEAPAAPAEEKTAEEEREEAENARVPEDLSEKIDAIARELFAIEEK